MTMMSNALLSVYTDTGHYAVSDADQRRIVAALTGEATRLVTQAKGRKYSGEHNRKVRAAMRDEAKQLRRIALALDIG
jgi:hypothetical protein